MDYLQKRTWAEISLQSIEHNIRELRATAPGARFLGVVKADAYGHGAVRVAGMMQEKQLVDMLAVACLDEAVELRKNGITLPVLIMGYTPAQFTSKLEGYGITQAIGDIETARQMSRELKTSLCVHIKLETGMGRTGFDPRQESFGAEMAELSTLPGLEVQGIFTHFAVADEPTLDFTEIQYRRFLEAAERVEEIFGRRLEIRHCANSGAVINYSEYSHDLVRPGIATYGMYPGADRGEVQLRQAMSLRSRITHVYDHHSGDSLSYGRTYILDETKRIAVLPIGYADGLHRIASGKYEFLLGGRRVRQLGRVCMDMCMIDVSDFPDCAVGDVVTIFGYDGETLLPVEEQAEKAGTISYEMVCAVSKRVPRIYTD